jgi:hypothetical protein
VVEAGGGTAKSVCRNQVKIAIPVAVIRELLQPFRLEPGAPLISDKVSAGKFGAKADYSL